MNLSREIDSQLMAFTDDNDDCLTLEEVMDSLVDLEKKISNEQYEEISKLKQWIEGSRFLPEQMFRQQRELVESVRHQIENIDRPQDLLAVTATTIRDILGVQRVLIYRVSDEIVTESLARGFNSAREEFLSLDFLGLTASSQKPIIIEREIAETKLTKEQENWWKKLQIKASLSLAIRLPEKTWGWLIIHDCIQARVWQEEEINLLTQIVNILAMKLQQLDYRQGNFAFLLPSEKSSNSQDLTDLKEIVREIKQLSDKMPQELTLTKNALEAIEIIRATVNSTNKQIKYLSESGQHIFHSIDLWKNLATQTQILAFNTSIVAQKNQQQEVIFMALEQLKREIRALSDECNAHIPEIEELNQEIHQRITNVAKAIEIVIDKVILGKKTISAGEQQENLIITWLELREKIITLEEKLVNIENSLEK